MVDLTKKKTLGEYETGALANGDTVVTYRPDNAVGEKVFRGEITEGTSASIATGTDTALKMYSDAELKAAINGGAIPIGTDTEIETGTDTTPKIYAPDQLNSAIDSLIETAVPDGTEAQVIAGTDTTERKYTPSDLNDAINSLVETAVPDGTEAQIIAGTDTTERKYTPADINGAVKDIAVAQYAGRTAMKAATGLTAGDVVYLSEGGRSGTFIWTLGDFTAQVAADTLQGVYVESDSEAVTVGCWVRELQGFVTPEMFGYDTSTGTADGAAVVLLSSVFGLELVVDSGTFSLSGVSLTTAIKIHVKIGATIKALTPAGLGSAYSTIKSTADNCRVIIDGIVDCNDSGVTFFNFEGDNCRVEINGRATGCSIKTGSATNVGVARFTGDNAFFYGAGDGFLRNGLSFASYPAAPRMFTLEGTADNWRCDWMTTYDATDGLVIGASTGSGSHGEITDYRTLDNTIYQLGGKCVGDGNITHIDGEDECLVCEGDYSNSGGLIVRGYCIAPLGIEDASRIKLGFIDWDDENKTRTSDGAYSGAVLRTRSGNSSSGDIEIGSIRAKYTGNALVACGTGLANRLICNDVDVLFRYTSLNPELNLNAWMAMAAFGSFNLSGWNVRIYDASDSLTSSTIFRGQCKTSLSGPSRWANMKFYTTFTTGFGAHKFRFSNLAQEYIETSGANWIASIPAVEESNLAANSGADSAESYPTTGAWNAGKYLQRRNIGAEISATDKSIGWQCVASGTPGQWVSVAASVVNVP